MTDPDLAAMMDQALAAARAQLRGEVDGLVIVFEVDGRGVMVGVDLEDPGQVASVLERLVSELRAL